ncbi:pancreatic lipase-related protein 2 isoform X1 [Augochlora pura]
MAVASPLLLLYPALLTSLAQNNYTIFPNELGEPFLVQLNYEALSELETTTLASDLNSITFTLFTRRNPTNGQILKLNDAGTVSMSNWNKNRETVIVTHGWKSKGTSSSCTLVRDAFLQVLDSNVIVVNWEQIANNVNYAQVAKSVPAVADHVASFVNSLRQRSGLKTSALKMVGHSLGAHVVSLAAKTVSKSSLVAEVIALDPAGPMFDTDNPNNRVDRSHAKNVQVVHTSILGLSKAVGKSDFYANGGSKQPGCSTDLVGACAHGRSYEYYSESIKHPKGFPGTPRNGGAIAYMGGPTLDPNAHGSYDFKTASNPPYITGK